jgi:hypothetical protein
MEAGRDSRPGSRPRRTGSWASVGGASGDLGDGEGPEHPVDRGFHHFLTGQLLTITRLRTITCDSSLSRIVLGPNSEPPKGMRGARGSPSRWVAVATLLTSLLLGLGQPHPPWFHRLLPTKIRPEFKQAVIVPTQGRVDWPKTLSDGDSARVFYPRST